MLLDPQGFYGFLGSSMISIPQRDLGISVGSPVAVEPSGTGSHLGLCLEPRSPSVRCPHIEVDQGYYLSMPLLASLATDTYPIPSYSIKALCIEQILDVFLGSTINTGTPYSLALSIIAFSSPFNAL